jgi:hypothetical protein
MDTNTDTDMDLDTDMNLDKDIDKETDMWLKNNALKFKLFLNFAKNKDCRKRYIHRINKFWKSKTVKNIEVINFEKKDH